MMERHQRHNKGYTLVEVVSVVTIIGAMMALAIPKLATQAQIMENQEAENILIALYDSQMDFERDTGDYMAEGTLEQRSGDLLVEFDDPHNFSEPILLPNSPVGEGESDSCGFSAVAMITPNDGDFELWITEHGEIRCTGSAAEGVCDISKCQKMGYPVNVENEG